MFDEIPADKYKENPFLRILQEKIRLPYEEMANEELHNFNFETMAEEARSSRLEKMILVKGLPFTSSKGTVEEIFKKFGHLTESHVISHKIHDQKGNPLKIFTGEALIGFSDTSTMNKVMKQDFECQGKELLLKAAKHFKRK